MSNAPRIDALEAITNTVEPRRNYIINGAMEISQRNSTFTQGPSASSIYTLDRWLMRSTGSNGINTVTRETLTEEELQPISYFEGVNYMRWDQTTLATSNPVLLQRVENVRTLSNRQVTVSFIAKMDASRSMDVKIDQLFGTGGSTTVSGATQTVNLTTSWQKFELTFTLASVVGKTFGVDINGFEDHYLEVEFLLPDNTTFTLDITEVKLEEGTSATNFVRAGKTLAEELRLCQRYYVKISTSDTVAAGICHLQTGNVHHIFVPTPVEMRAEPSLSQIGAVAGNIAAVRGTTSNFNIAYNNLPSVISLKASGVSLSIDSGSSIGQSIGFITFGGQNIFFDAEL